MFLSSSSKYLLSSATLRKCMLCRPISTSSVLLSLPPSNPIPIDPKELPLRTAEDRRNPTRDPRHASMYALGKHRSNGLDLVNKQPVIEVDGERAICDGGGGALGHPINYISLARPGTVQRCVYCALQYTKKKSKGH